MSSSRRVSVNIKQGQDERFLFTAYRDRERTQILPFTNWSNPQMQIRKSRGSMNDPSQLLYTVPCLIDPDPTTGKIRFKVPATESVKWTQPIVYADLFCVDPDGNRICLIELDMHMDFSETRI